MADFCKAALHREDAAEIVVGLEGAGIDGNCLAQRRHRLVERSHLLKRDAEIDQDMGCRGIGGDGAAIARHRLAGLADLAQQRAEIEMRLGEVGTQHDRAAKRGLGFGRAAGRGERAPEDIDEHGIVRRQANRDPEVLDRLRGARRLRAQSAEEIARLGIGRADGDEMPINRIRRVDASRPAVFAGFSEPSFRIDFGDRR